MDFRKSPNLPKNLKNITSWGGTQMKRDFSFEAPRFENKRKPNYQNRFVSFPDNMIGYGLNRTADLPLMI